ncbi:MAG: LVIVD repeat-containing protein [Chitinophagales bacterium]
MKRQLQYLLILCIAVISGSFLQSCTNDKANCVYTYMSYEPVYMSLETLRGTIQTTAARPIKSPGKIYYKYPYIFINEREEGLHVIYNRHPESPQNIAFIEIPGNVDIAMADNIMYADNYMDLVVLDLSDPENVQLVNRVENLFDTYYYIDPEKGLIVDWTPTEVTESYNCEESPDIWPWGYYAEGYAIDTNSPINSNNGGSTGAPSVGVGGSMARFTIASNHLYTLTTSDMNVFDINELANPIQKDPIHVGWNIETIYPFKDMLLIGSQSGMFIYNIQEPSLPLFVSEYTHVRSCDPVVAAGNTAYVTLRSGTACQGFTNQLEVLDISDVTEPDLLKIYPMQNPHGLGIDNNTLFICDGEAGLKAYNAEDPLKIDENLLAHYNNIHAFDAIPLGETLLLIGEDGFHQYDYSDPTNIQWLSTIAVEK